MRYFKLVLLAVAILGVPKVVWGLDNEHFSAIKRLGQLNGIALHCRALEETQRMKQALVLNLPKRRQLGELFDNETHHSFMKFIQEDAVCPDSDHLRDQVDEAIRVLEVVFKP